MTIFIVLLLQMLLPNYLPFFKYVDLPLVVTVYFGLQRAPMLGMLTGTALGLGGDRVAGGILGVGGFAKTLIGYLVAMASVRFALENPLARLAIVALSSVTNTVLFIGLNLMLERPVAEAGTYGGLGRLVGWKVLADTAAAIVMFIVLDRVFSEQAAARRMAIKKRFYE
ncbi:MAG TPA: rod shape-determining protein MreD [Blastocatellia bacterium]|nr:rod shape-determining protein MreD [Blastocatellia bacterium]